MKTPNCVKFCAMALILGVAMPVSAAEVVRTTEVQRIVVLDSDRALINSVDMNVRNMEGTFSVDAENGVVTLIGIVKNKAAMDSIVAAASQTPGVKSVDNQLRIDPAYASMGTAYTDPLNIERQYAPEAMESRIRYNLRPYADVVTKMEDGVVVLSGYVPTAADRVRAARLVSRIDGVTGVRNELVVR